MANCILLFLVYLKRAIVTSSVSCKAFETQQPQPRNI